MTEDEIPDYNIFMMCDKLNASAMTAMQDGYHIRSCKPQELDIWKQFPFDSNELAAEYDGFMVQYFNETYGSKEDLFFKNTLFVCDKEDRPLATCSTWKAYEKFNTIQWFKTLKNHEGKGIGRALFSLIMERFKETDYPIYLHSQPSSFHAIKLYTDFGFSLLSDPVIGSRTNNLEKSLPILREFMPKLEFEFERLKIHQAPLAFIESLKNETNIQF